jgi:hypothetical protein
MARKQIDLIAFTRAPQVKRLLEDAHFVGKDDCRRDRARRIRRTSTARYHCQIMLSDT